MNNSLDLMRARLQLRGGIAQQDRMIADKLKNLNNIIAYSYQGAKVKKIGTEEECGALINPNIVKQDYDDKIISIDYKYDYKIGTIFEWVGTGTKWLIYLQDLTELAYFKGDIRKCNYEIKWRDANGIQSTYAAIRGPVEAKIDYTAKERFEIDLPNHSLNILIPDNEQTRSYFKRYAEFYLQGDEVCWRIEGVDNISTPGILEINAVEYYGNEQKDSEGIVDNLVVEPVIPPPQAIEIDGPVFIKPKITYNYTCSSIGDWSWDTKLTLEIKIKDDNSISLKWTTTYTGQFILRCGELEKTIVVESLF